MSDLKFSEKTSFELISTVLEEIHNAPNRNRKEEIMRKFIAEFWEQSKRDKDGNFYPILRLILPKQDNERSAYGIKEHTMAKSYIRILCLANSSKEASKLLNYKSPTSMVDGCADFADVAYWIIRSRCTFSGSINVYKVNLHLDNIANKHANNDPRGVDDELKTLINEMSPLEQKWLIRIILKDMHLGLSHQKIMSMFHPDAVALFDFTNNLKKVCETLKDPSIRLNEIEIVLFQPFKPMLSKRCDVETVETDIKNADFYFMEVKFDGERFQLHYRNGEFKYFSRNAYDYTNTFGSNFSNGTLTPKLQKNFSSKINECILDGEMMCWNSKRKCYTTKGMNIDVKSLRTDHVNKPCFCVFDILLLNGQILTNKPLKERIELLKEMVISEEGVIMISVSEIVESRNEILHYLSLAIDNCEEGIIIKDPNSVYKPNARNAGWYKIKPEYTEGMMVELDMLIIGGYYGEGRRRRGIISQFLLGVADSIKNRDEESPTFYSVGRVGSGYSDDELAELNKRLEPHWKNEIPSGVQCSKEKAHLWIEPKSSVILQIRATEIIPADAFRTGYTCRFPRVQKIRYDKPWFNCLTVVEFTEIRTRSKGKLTANYSAKPSTSTSPSRKVKRRIKKPATVDEECLSKKAKNVQVKTGLFNNREFCILTGSKNSSYSKGDLEHKVIENGGTVVQHPGGETYCVVASEETVRVSNIIRLNKYNIVRDEWLLRCIEENALKKWCPDDFISMEPNTRQQISEEYDCYGDSFTEPVETIRLTRILTSIEILEHEKISPGEMTKLDKMLFDRSNRYGLFRKCFAVFCHDYEDCNCQYQIDTYREMFKFYGGNHQEEIDDKTTHLIAFSNRLPSHFIDVIKTRNIYAVTKKWLSDSWKTGVRAVESRYSMNNAHKSSIIN